MVGICDCYFRFVRKAVIFIMNENFTKIITPGYKDLKVMTKVTSDRTFGLAKDGNRFIFYAFLCCNVLKRNVYKCFVSCHVYNKENSNHKKGIQSFGQ